MNRSWDQSVHEWNEWPYKRGPRELTHPCHQCEDTAGSVWPRRRPSPSHAGTLVLDFQPPELWEINILLFTSHPSPWYFVIAVWMTVMYFKQLCSPFPNSLVYSNMHLYSLHFPCLHFLDSSERVWGVTQVSACLDKVSVAWSNTSLDVGIL